MQFMILGFLLSGPLSLYDLQKRFASGPSSFYSASSGSIQRALRHLVDAGWATVETDPANGRGRRLHRRTAAGESAWRAWMLDPGAGTTDAETTALAKVYLLGRLDDAGDRRRVLAGIRERAAASREELQGIADDVDARSAAFDAATLRLFEPQRATLDYGLRTHDLLLEWVRELEAAQR